MRKEIMNKTSIEYLTHSWNPIAMRCTPVSEGCAHCWHLRMADRFIRQVIQVACYSDIHSNL